MTAQLPSRERLAEIHKLAAKSDKYIYHLRADEVEAMTRALLAEHEQEPVYQVMLLDGSPEQNEWVEVRECDFHTPVKNQEEWKKRILYTHPAPSIPAAVPEEATPATIDMMARKFKWGAAECIAAIRSWNACRDAMIQANLVARSDKRLMEMPHAVGIAPGVDYDFCPAKPGNSPLIPNSWIPVSERLPDNADSVVTSNGFDIGRGWWDGDS